MMRNRRSPIGLGSTILATLATGVAMLSMGSSSVARASVTRASSTDTCTVSATLVNSCRPWLGAVANYYTQAPGGPGEQSQILYHEQRINRAVDVVRSFYSVNATGLSSGDLYFGNRPNTYLDINWNPSTTWAPATVAAHDKTIDDMAKSIASLPNKVFLTLWHEPENDVTKGTDPSCPGLGKGKAGSPAQYVAMWKYVENRFATTDKVTNVVWAMDYMNWPPWLCFVPALYPGDKLVNWILFNGYGNGSTPNFVTDVNHLYAWFTQHSGTATSGHDYLSKPWGIAEWSITGYPVATEENYFTQAQAALDGNVFPNLKMYNIYDSINTADSDNYRVGYDDDGTVDPTKGSYYYAFADDPRFTDAYYNTPAAPTGLTATAVSNTEIDLSWTEPTGSYAAGYYVYRSDDAGVTYSPIANVTSGTTYDDTGLASPDTYYYKVQAYNTVGGDSAQSSPANATVPPVTTTSTSTTTTTTTGP